MSPARALRDLATDMDHWLRQGAENDEPEGDRYIVVSDGLLRRVANTLRAISDSIPG